MKFKIGVWCKYTLLLFTMVSFMTSCSRNPVTGKKEFMLMSEGQEISLGKESDPSIVASFGLFQDQKLQKFIDQKGQQMAKVSHRPNLKYEFKVLDSPVVNAFAVPGGYVYFTRGILAHFNNEAEFAGVLGHEIGHISARHSAKAYSKQMLAQAAMIGGIVFSEKFRGMANAAGQGLGLLFLKFGRDNESESDELGVEYSTKIGYDSHNMAHFFQTLKNLQNDSGQSIPDFLSTHPNPANREAKVHEMSDYIQKNVNKSSLKTNRDSYLRMIDGLIYGEDPQQGYTEANVFYHPQLKFKFPVPSSWRLNNSPAAVQMAPSAGDAVITFMLSNEKTLRATANKVVSDNKLTVIESNDTKVNGLPAMAMLTEQVSQGQNGQQAKIRILSYYIQYAGNIYIFHGMSDVNDFNKYYPNFQKTMKSFNKLTDASKINRKPERIVIKEVARAGSLQQVLSGFGMTAAQQKILSTLNGMALNTQLKKGTLIKTLGK